MSKMFDENYVPLNETGTAKRERYARIACRSWYGVKPDEIDQWDDYGASSKQRWIDMASRIEDLVLAELKKGT